MRVKGKSKSPTDEQLSANENHGANGRLAFFPYANTSHPASDMGSVQSSVTAQQLLVSLVALLRKRKFRVQDTSFCRDLLVMRQLCRLWTSGRLVSMGIRLSMELQSKIPAAS